MSTHVVRGEWFFKPAQADGLEGSGTPDGLGTGHGLVRIDHDVPPRPDRVADGLKSAQILGDTGFSDLDLDSRPPLRLGGKGACNQLVRTELQPPTLCVVKRNHLTVATGGTPKRGFGSATVDVPHRRIDGRQGQRSDDSDARRAGGVKQHAPNCLRTSSPSTTNWRAPQAPANAGYDSYKRFSAHDDRLHALILKIAGNRVTAKAIERTHFHLHAFRLGYDIVAGGHTLEEHAAVVDAISAGDSDAAVDAMKTHLERSMSRLLPISSDDGDG